MPTAEVEFCACVEAAKEVPFIAQILLFMGIKVELPAKARIDNVGAMFMSENVSSAPRTRHMDSRLWWLTDLQETGLADVSFAPTKDNVADVGTKNVTGDVMDQLRPMLMTNKPCRLDSCAALRGNITLNNLLTNMVSLSRAFVPIITRFKPKPSQMILIHRIRLSP